MSPRRFPAYAWGVLAFFLLVVLWGAYVRATGSGAGCGSHWPLCNGVVVPRDARIETLVEYTHRITSGIALVTVIVLAVWAYRIFPKGHHVRLAAALSLALTVVEALLGAGLVLFELVTDNASGLRAFSMVAHLLNTFILIGALALTAWWSSGGPPVAVRERPGEARLLGLALAALLAVGATGAIAALGDTLFPSASLSEGMRNSFSSESPPLIQLRKYQPLLAILLGLYVVSVSRIVAKRDGNPIVSRLSSVLMLLYITQLLAGTINMVLLAPVAMQLVHLLLADLAWITLIIFTAAVLAVTEETRPPSQASRGFVRTGVGR
jgi:heme A synthase